MTDLTRPGWPRPVVGGWPVPWVSPQHDLSNMDAARKVALLDTRMCQVCGLCHSPGDLVFLCVQTAVDDQGRYVAKPEDATAVVPMDEGLMHERCARLALARCPRLRELRKRRSLLVLRVPVDDVYVHNGEQAALLTRAVVADSHTCRVVYNQPEPG
jgi:hypothetical protein